MDQFNVPKKVNRSVLKAVKKLQAIRPGYISKAMICKEVKKQLQRTKPVKNINITIAKSLTNLTGLGVLSCTSRLRYGCRDVGVGDVHYRSRIDIPGVPVIRENRQECAQTRGRLSPMIRPRHLATGGDRVQNGRVTKRKNHAALIKRRQEEDDEEEDEPQQICDEAGSSEENLGNQDSPNPTEDSMDTSDEIHLS